MKPKPTKRPPVISLGESSWSNNMPFPVERKPGQRIKLIDGLNRVDSINIYIEDVLPDGTVKLAIEGGQYWEIKS